MREYQFHPAAEIFPLMQGDEFDELKEDIRQNGQLEPIWLHPDGRILDGRNRYLACVDIGFEAHFETWKGQDEDVVSFVVSLNDKRRHLTPSQRGAVGLKIEKYEAERAKERLKQAGKSFGKGVARIPQAIEDTGKARDKAAKTAKASPRYISDAKRLDREAPDLLASVVSGEKTIPQANRELRKRETVKREIESVQRLQLVETPRLWTLTAAQDVVKCDAVITDPPYGILKESWEPAKLEDFTREWLRRWNKCGADTFFVFWSQAHLFAGRPWFDDELSNYSFQQLLVWHYRNNKSPQSRMGFKQTWEPILFYRRNGSERKIGVSSPEWGDDLHDFDCHVAAVPQSNFNGADMKQHAAQKPVSVFRWLINAATTPGERVADPFAGSGTCGIATSQLRRRFHGIEIEEDSLQLAERRISTYGIREPEHGALSA